MLTSLRPLPSMLARRFTIGQQAVLKIVADEVRRKGFCALYLGEIAARAGVCLTLARDAIREALRDGSIDALCSDHTPVDEDEKQVPFGESAPGASGVELLLPLTLKWAREMGVPLMRALDLISWKPAQILGVPGGNLSIGGYADLCIFDESAEWVVTPKTLASQGDNTPFLDHPMQGRVRYTVIDGHIDFEAPR